MKWPRFLYFIIGVIRLCLGEPSGLLVAVISTRHLFVASEMSLPRPLGRLDEAQWRGRGVEIWGREVRLNCPGRRSSDI